jgi:hypothetical protein
VLQFRQKVPLEKLLTGVRNLKVLKWHNKFNFSN